MKERSETGPELKRLRIDIHGAVQGVGFRPFIHRLAASYQLSGWIRNNAQGVHIEAEGHLSQLQAFLCAIQGEAPPQARIFSLKHIYLDPAHYEGFKILDSVSHGPSTAWILPDIATCPDCLRDVFDAQNRRYRYPFTNCTNCGPRFSIIESIPYDRPNTSMKSFTMCPECLTEYENPEDRRFHAQPNACPECGPHLRLCDGAGREIASFDEAIIRTVQAVRDGQIVAVKGLGGFHLIVDAANDGAVGELRKRKRREQKPFALMFPDIDSIQKYCRVSDLERRWLMAPEAPILLLDKNEDHNSGISFDVAPGNPCLGVLLPYTPLHHILLNDLKRPVVATSGNLSEDPICINDQEALDRLKSIADVFLLHNRPIVRPVDDSVGRLMADREMILRRARGYAPLPIPLRNNIPPVLAVGGHLKNTVTLAKGKQAVVSQHIGDLESEPARRHFRNIRSDLKQLFNIEPEKILHDKHPDYTSTREAQDSGLKTAAVQHHLAHILACMLDNKAHPPVLGVAWDGTGYGVDASIWGGEFFLVEEKKWRRFATFRPFPLPGGDMAVREPRRSALGLLHEKTNGRFDRDLCPAVWDAFRESERSVLMRLLSNTNMAILTSSMGRLFDAVASILGVQHINHYEGQAAMQLEYLAGRNTENTGSYPFKILEKNGTLIIDWEPMIRQILARVNEGIPVEIIACHFHQTLAEMILQIARRADQREIVLSGGCFQNRLLSEITIHRLEETGFNVIRHQQIPPNDGCISLGQVGAVVYGLV